MPDGQRPGAALACGANVPSGRQSRIWVNARTMNLSLAAPDIVSRQDSGDGPRIRRRCWRQRGWRSNASTSRARHRRGRIPARIDAGVHQQMAGFGVQQRLPAQPVQQRRGVARAQQLVQRIAAARPQAARRDCQRPQVVIAEHDGGALAQRPDPPQRRG